MQTVRVLQPIHITNWNELKVIALEKGVRVGVTYNIVSRRKTYIRDGYHGKFYYYHNTIDLDLLSKLEDEILNLKTYRYNVQSKSNYSKQQQKKPGYVYVIVGENVWKQYNPIRTILPSYSPPPPPAPVVAVTTNTTYHEIIILLLFIFAYMCIQCVFIGTFIF